MYFEMAYNKKQIIRLKENLPKVKVNLPQTQTFTRTFSCYAEQLWAGLGRGNAVVKLLPSAGTEAAAQLTEGVGYLSGDTGVCGPPARRDLVPSAITKGEAWVPSFLALPRVWQGGRMLGVGGRAWKGGARLAGAPWWWVLSPPQEALGRSPAHRQRMWTARKPVEPARGVKCRGVERELGSAPGRPRETV